MTNVTVGAVVVVNEADILRNEWKMGGVTEYLKSSDGLVRSVKDKMGGKNSGQDSSLERPVHKIVALARLDALIIFRRAGAERLLVW